MNHEIDNCDGSHTCPSRLHIFGCYRSTLADERREREQRDLADLLRSENTATLARANGATSASDPTMRPVTNAEEAPK